jgi:hypothetical protein
MAYLEMLLIVFTGQIKMVCHFGMAHYGRAFFRLSIKDDIKAVRKRRRRHIVHASRSR